MYASLFAMNFPTQTLPRSARYYVLRHIAGKIPDSVDLPSELRAQGTDPPGTHAISAKRALQRDMRTVALTDAIERGIDLEVGAIKRDLRQLTRSHTRLQATA